ncbi:amidohydrolase family protein, partial [Mycolicibacterium sp. CBMA 361]
MEWVPRAEWTLVDGELRPAAVGVAAGRIEFIGPLDADCSAAEEVRIPDTAVLMPGFVDTHVHVNEPGTDWEGFDAATAAAAAAGVTTLVDMPLDSDPVTTTVPALVAKIAAAEGHCHVDVGYWGGVIPGNLDELTPLLRAGVRGFKCFLTESGNPRFPHLTPTEFRRAMARIAELRSVLLVHAESHQVIAAT